MARAAADLPSASTAPGRPIPATRDKEFNRDAYEQFRLPERLGNAIAAWDDPEVVAGADATHMRGDDYVIGLTWNGSARAYPLWVVDNYHAINDTIDGQRILVASCERCQSGAAFAPNLPVHSGRPPLFRAIGVLNAVLLFKDLATGTWWNHYEGVGLKGRFRGQVLPWVPTYHMEWTDWLAMHPGTDVMLPPTDPTHPDARHGHGREESFSRPGMDPAFVATIVGPLDERYLENEMVLAVGEPVPMAYPLREVQREGGVVHDERTGTLVFAGPHPDGFTMAAFEAPEGSASYRRDVRGFVDEVSGSVWRVDGLAVEGPRRGERLRPRRWSYVRWHAWVYMHRDTSLFLSDRPRPAAHLDVEDPEGFGKVLGTLSAEGHDIRIEGPPVSQLRPREAVASLTVQGDGSRIQLHRFDTVRAARDYHGLGGGWSSLPLRAQVRNGKTRRLGRVVVMADPERRFADPAQVVPLSTTEMTWSDALFSPGLDEFARGGGEDARHDPDPGFLDLIRALKLAGYEVIEAGFLPPAQLRVGCSNGVALTIEGDRFLLYRFTTRDGAEAYAAAEPHARAFATFVLRSTPDTSYHHQLYEILYAGDGLIRWSSLLDTPRFVNTVHRAVKPRVQGGEA